MRTDTGSWRHFVGSTKTGRAIVDPVLHLMMTAVNRYGGYVAQSTGYGVFAIFGAPVAHEHHPQRALHAALAMQEELRRGLPRSKEPPGGWANGLNVSTTATST